MSMKTSSQKGYPNPFSPPGLKPRPKTTTKTSRASRDNNQGIPTKTTETPSAKTKLPITPNLPTPTRNITTTMTKSTMRKQQKYRQQLRR